MAGLLSGLSKLGLGSLESAQIYEEPKEEADGNKGKGAEVPEIHEKDLILDRTFECPVCDSKLTSKMMKTGKAKLLRTDLDLRAVYEGVDAQKYDVISCPTCGFTALSRYYKRMPDGQVRLIKENISKNVRITPHKGEIYTYEEAMERYKLALACAIVKQSRASEKAYICLKSAWLLRGWQEELTQKDNDKEQLAQLQAEEREYLQNALDGFIAAKGSESYPLCGMDEITVDYLIAVLAFWFGKYDISSKLIASILTSPSASARVKDKARNLKDILMAELRKGKE